VKFSLYDNKEAKNGKNVTEKISKNVVFIRYCNYGQGENVNSYCLHDTKAIHQ